MFLNFIVLCEGFSFLLKQEHLQAFRSVSSFCRLCSVNWSKCKQTQECWATLGDGMYIRVITLPRHLYPFHFYNNRAPYQRHVTIKLIIIITIMIMILRQKRKRKRSQQRQNGTKIIDYYKRVTIQYCTYYIMIRFVPGSRFSHVLVTSQVIFWDLNLGNSVAGIRSKSSLF